MNKHPRDQFKEIRCPVPFCRAWPTPAGLKVFAGQEPGIGWHLSISHPSRYPNWDEIKDARYRFCPDDVDMVMHLPPRSQYVNVHNHCFHLHELREAAAQAA